MSQPGRRTRPGNYPVLQERVLGWTIAGRTPANTTVEYVKRAFLQRETRIVKHQACEEHLHTQPNRGGSSCGQTSNQDGIHSTWNFSFIAKQGPHTTDRMLKRGPNMKVQDRNFLKEHEEIIHKKSVKFQEGNKTFYFLPHQPVSKETSSTTKTH